MSRKPPRTAASGGRKPGPRPIEDREQRLARRDRVFQRVVEVAADRGALDPGDVLERGARVEQLDQALGQLAQARTGLAHEGVRIVDRYGVPTQPRALEKGFDQARVRNHRRCGGLRCRWWWRHRRLWRRIRLPDGRRFGRQSLHRWHRWCSHWRRRRRHGCRSWIPQRERDRRRRTRRAPAPGQGALAANLACPGRRCRTARRSSSQGPPRGWPAAMRLSAARDLAVVVAARADRLTARNRTSRPQARSCRVRPGRCSGGV